VFVCLFVILFVIFGLYGYGFLSSGKATDVKFCMRVAYYPDSSSPLLVDFGSRGVTAAALLWGGAWELAAGSPILTEAAIQRSQWGIRNWGRLRC